MKISEVINKNYQALKRQLHLDFGNKPNLLYYWPSIGTLDGVENMDNNHLYPIDFHAVRFDPTLLSLNVYVRLFNQDAMKIDEYSIRNLKCNQPYPNKMYDVGFIKSGNMKINGLALPFPELEVNDHISLDVIEEWSYDFDTLFSGQFEINVRPFTRCLRFEISGGKLSNHQIMKMTTQYSNDLALMDRVPKRLISEYNDFSDVNPQTIVAYVDPLYLTDAGFVMNRYHGELEQVKRDAETKVELSGFTFNPNQKSIIDRDLKKPFALDMTASILNLDEPISNNQTGFNHNGFGSMAISLNANGSKFEYMMPGLDLKNSHYPNAYDFEDKYQYTVPA